MPITKEIKKITGPLQPIVDVITAPIPVVSDLAELVGSPPITMISLARRRRPAPTSSLIKALAAFITFVNAIPDGAGLAPIPLGGRPDIRRCASGRCRSRSTRPRRGTSVSPTEAGSLIKQDATFKGGTGFTADVGEVSVGTASPSSVQPCRPIRAGPPRSACRG